MDGKNRKAISPYFWQAIFSKFRYFGRNLFYLIEKRIENSRWPVKKKKKKRRHESERWKNILGQNLKAKGRKRVVILKTIGMRRRCRAFLISVQQRGKVINKEIWEIKVLKVEEWIKWFPEGYPSSMSFSFPRKSLALKVLALDNKISNYSRTKNKV